jgi:hypothetical protein
MTSIPVSKYFTATDIQIYLGGVLLDEAFSIEYAMSSPKYPVQGYHSRRVQAWADGVEICQGNLEMNFKYRNELSLALDSSLRVPISSPPPPDNSAKIRSCLEALGPVIQWSYEIVGGQIVPIRPLSQIILNGTGNVWKRRPNDPNTKSSMEDTLVGLGIPFESIKDFEGECVGHPSADPTIWVCDSITGVISSYTSMFATTSAANYNLTVARSSPQQLKNTFWNLKPATKFPVPFDAQFTSLTNDLEIWMLLSIETIGNDLKITPREKIIIKDIHFTGEAIPMGMQQRDYIRVMYPFVASHVE